MNFQCGGRGHPAYGAGTAQWDELSRDVYGVLGIPIDALDLSEVVQRIGAAMRDDAAFLISTPNLNFLVSSQTDPEFRESLLKSDLCPVDGVPIVWISRLLGVPVRRRVAGSDIFDRLKQEQSASVKVFLFGGREGVAETCSTVLNDRSGGVTCVGTLFPGFGTVDEMSTDAIIDAINASEARFLVASLGAQKGQSWLMKNHHRLRVPVRSHLGAAINFQAGLLKRAPPFVRRFGFEWLWRIKQEPHLWRRYFDDGLVLLKLMLTNVLPLAVGARWRSLFEADGTALDVSLIDGPSNIIRLAGHAIARHVTSAIPLLREALDNGDWLTLDVSGVTAIDPRFFGLLLVVRKQLMARGGRLEIIGACSHLKRAFRLNRFDFLLKSTQPAARPRNVVDAPDLGAAYPEVTMGVSSAALRP